MTMSEGHILAALIATITKGLRTVHVNLYSLRVEENARLGLHFGNTEQRRHIS